MNVNTLSESDYGQTQVALIFSDSDAAARESAQAVTAAGGRIGANLSLSDGIKRLDEQAVVDAILVNISTDSGAALDQFLDRVDYFTRHEKIPVFVSTPFAHIDRVAARISADQAIILCAPDLSERVTSLAYAWSDRQARLNDISYDLDSVKFRRMADEVSRMARTLASLAATRSAESPRWCLHSGFPNG